MLEGKLLLATRNEDKIVEIKQLLHGFDFTIHALSDYVDLPETIEDRDSLKGNAIKKAQEAFKQTGMPALADDTGLEVDALDGRPGIYSARYAGNDATYSDNVNKLLKELKFKTGKERCARFKTVAALKVKNKIYLFDGVCEGRITDDLKAKQGFGYDPVFRPDGYEKTFAEMDMETKNQISHRGRAFKKVAAFLEYYTHYVV